MMKKSSKWMIFVAVVLALGFFATFPASAPAAEKIKIGYLVADQLHQYLLPIGIEKGYFKEEGIEVETPQYAASGILMQSFAAKEMDIGLVGVSGAMISQASGADVKIIGTNNWGGSSLVVDPKVGKFEDLKGQTVGNPGIGSNHHTLLTLLEKKYNTPVKKATIKPTDMPIMAQNKEVQAIICYEPHPTRVMKIAGFKRLLSSNEILKDQQCCVLVAQPKLVKEKPALVLKVMKVNARATKFVRENKAEAVKIIAKYSGITEDVLADAYDNMIYPWPPRVNVESSLVLLQGIIDADKIEKSAIKPNVQEWWKNIYDTSFEEELLKSGYIAQLEGKK
jgi:NitT/TauT family transport system substrate-binding protein